MRGTPFLTFNPGGFNGLTPREAAVVVGSADGARRWFWVAGGVKGNGPGPVSGRYLSLAEREEIAVGAARGSRTG